ncbi:MAG TPA: HAMP domain-containing sensor histidine kinase [Steroidobacteraceae bacterium]|nr:HAMP domain-containing sensor histidine kinase [Steroidobacteraceae bacterium]
MKQSNAASPTSDETSTSSTDLASVDLAWRILSLVNLFRLLVPLVLGALFALMSPRPVGQLSPALFAATAAAYFLFAVAAISSIRRTWPTLDIQAVVHVAVDILAIALMTFASSSAGNGFAALLVLPVGACALIVPPRIARLMAAIAAIALLVGQGIAFFVGNSDLSDITSAGLVGALIFAVTVGVAPLAKRLRESEALIRQRDFDIANLAELNEFIVQHLRESILVVDEDDRIRLINESAGQLLSGATIAGGTLVGEVSPRLLFLLNSWRKQGYDWQGSTLSLVAAGGAAVIQPHFVSLDPSTTGPTLIFLEDTSAIAERLQQSKLAALGRLSASIAHEVRNPVGSMSHAAQLLREATSIAPQDQRLIEIIIVNGERVSTIINNILQLSRRESIRQERINLNGWLASFTHEFSQTQQTSPGQIHSRLSPLQLDVRADPSHVHQILWNLCENALKYGQRGDGAPTFELTTGRSPVNNRPFLEVADRGPGITTADTERIFEPFFTTGGSNGSTGLGLFIARELANANGAVLLYEPRQGGGSIFRLVFADPQRWEV